MKGWLPKGGSIMKSSLVRKALWPFAAVLLFSLTTLAQKTRPRPAPLQGPIIFAVLNDGKLVEPIAFVKAGKLVAREEQLLSMYYKPKRSYTLIFGGKADGSSIISKSNVGSECGGSSADVISRPATAALKGLVMALATNAKITKPGSGLRRRPTAEERTEIEALVRSEFTRQKTSASQLKNLRYHNLTGLDLDSDGTVEFVGSYWLAPSDSERRTLFFIAERKPDGKYAFSHRDYSEVKPEDVMSGDVKDLDTGVGHELLLDIFDYDNDGVSEIFTLVQAFEGNNYHVYERENGKWVKALETYVYRCAY